MMMLIKIDILIFFSLLCSFALSLCSRCPRDRINDKPHCLTFSALHNFFFIFGAMYEPIFFSSFISVAWLHHLHLHSEMFA